MKIVFATNNLHKLNEIKSIILNGIEIISLSEIGCKDEIPETGATLEANASQKSFYVFEKYGCNCFADDTGLEIDALNNRPGVYSARYAGENCNFEDNMNKVLSEMQNVDNRKACFRTIISLIISGREIQFEGKVEGTILKEKHGQKGFGYDPIFQPDGYEQTFAEMPPDLKNSISHRAEAVKKLIHYLETEVKKK
jgi:XTP/dITP diphosphohydrolase